MGALQYLKSSPRSTSQRPGSLKPSHFRKTTVVHRALNSGAGDEKGRYICSRGTYPIFAIWHLMHVWEDGAGYVWNPLRVPMKYVSSLDLMGSHIHSKPSSIWWEGEKAEQPHFAMLQAASAAANCTNLCGQPLYRLMSALECFVRYSRVLHVLSGETAGNLAPLWWEPDAFFTVLTCDSRTNSHSFSSTSCTSPRSTWNVGAFTPCQDDPKLLNSDSQQGRQAMYISDWKMYDICQKGYWQHIQHASTCSLVPRFWGLCLSKSLVAGVQFPPSQI